MRWSFRVTRVYGTEIRIHVTFLLLLGLLAAGAWGSGGAAAALNGTAFILLLFLSVLLHEMGHALAARRYGIATPYIVLLPIGGIAALQGMPRQPRRELVIAVAGPAVNVAIAIVLAGALALAGADAVPFSASPGARVGMARALLNANVALVLFNLLPAFPMDGGRMLRAVLATRMEYVRATRIAARTGQGFAFLLAAVGLAVNPLLLLIALVVYVGAGQEAAMVGLQAAAARHLARDAMLTDLRALPPDATLLDARVPLLRTPQNVFPVLDEDGRLAGLLTSGELIAALAAGDPRRPVAGVMHTDVPRISPATPLDEAVRRMGAARASALAVTDAEGRLLGLVTPESVGRLVALEGAPSPAPAAGPGPLPTPLPSRG